MKLCTGRPVSGAAQAAFVWSATRVNSAVNSASGSAAKYVLAAVSALPESHGSHTESRVDSISAACPRRPVATAADTMVWCAVHSGPVNTGSSWNGPARDGSSTCSAAADSSLCTEESWKKWVAVPVPRRSTAPAATMVWRRLSRGGVTRKRLAGRGAARRRLVLRGRSVSVVMVLLVQGVVVDADVCECDAAAFAPPEVQAAGGRCLDLQ